MALVIWLIVWLIKSTPQVEPWNSWMISVLVAAFLTLPHFFRTRR